MVYLRLVCILACACLVVQGYQGLARKSGSGNGNGSGSGSASIRTSNKHRYQQQTLTQVYSNNLSSDSAPKSPTESTRSSVRQISSFISAAVFTSAAVLLPTSAARAKVFFDTDTYGDKELKIASVNKLKQKIRNAILEDYNVAPMLLMLAINDALGYDIATDDGGPNGSIIFEKDRQVNKGLDKAFNVVSSIKKELQRTNTLSFGDVCSFAGAEALETVGSSRIVVQIGRENIKVADKKTSGIPWGGKGEEGGSVTREDVFPAMQASGLDVRDIVLLLGGLGEINRIVAETKAAVGGSADDEDDDSFEPQPFVPSTFGSRDNMYGAKMGKGDFGNKYFQALLKSKSVDGDVYGRMLLDDEATKALVKKYATNEPAFKQEVGEAYLKLTSLGAAYTTRNS